MAALSYDNQEEEILHVLVPMYEAGSLTLGNDGKFYATGKQDLSGYWLFTDATRNDDCSLKFNILFQRFNLVPPSGCLDCWKIVIKPRTVAECIEVYEIINAMGVQGKAGYDARDYTAGHWAAFVYTGGVKEAQEMWVKVRRAIPIEIPVILKRGCTEMEEKIPSTRWKVFPEQLEFENKLFSMLEMTGYMQRPEWLKRYKINKWIRKAAAGGDFSVDTGKIQFTVPSIQYQRPEWLKEAYGQGDI